MPYILQNKEIEIHIDLPLENYQFSRFDWTGKIAKVLFQNKLISGVEQQSYENENLIGKGFFNEFGIDTPLGFEETQIGEWFHKLGVGMLKKEKSDYYFNYPYTIIPAKFKVIKKRNSVILICIGKNLNGYAYVLQKTISIDKDGFIIHYLLQNTGTKSIITDEYVHNFLQINNEFMGVDYVLNFPFQLKPALFKETVNTEAAVIVGKNNFRFVNTPKKDFFFSNLSGNKTVNAQWELLQLKDKIGISEKGNFNTQKINLWGWTHVICPELFYNINLKPGKKTEWLRTFTLFNLTQD